jgi:hypothetical protein
MRSVVNGYVFPKAPSASRLALSFLRFVHPAWRSSQMKAVELFSGAVAEYRLRVESPHLSVGPRARFVERLASPTLYEEESQLDGLLTQAVTLLQPLANPFPMFVFLTATQKTRATSRTIKVYSTRP